MGILSDIISTIGQSYLDWAEDPYASHLTYILAAGTSYLVYSTLYYLIMRSRNFNVKGKVSRCFIYILASCLE